MSSKNKGKDQKGPKSNDKDKNKNGGNAGAAGPEDTGNDTLNSPQDTADPNASNVDPIADSTPAPIPTTSLPAGPPPIYFHPEFDRDGDFIITSKSHIHFKTYAAILKMSSPILRDMLSLPGDQEQKVSLDDDTDTIASILRLTTCQMLPPLANMEQVMKLLDFAEKYQMDGPLSFIRAALVAPHILEAHSLDVYQIASRLGWENEARLASTATLQHDLFDQALTAKLGKLSGRAMLRLITFHEERKRSFRTALRRHEEKPCPNCNRTVDSNKFWKPLERRFILEMDKRPRGDALSHPSFFSWEEAMEAASSNCRGDKCTTRVFWLADVYMAMEEILRKLPQSI